MLRRILPLLLLSACSDDPEAHADFGGFWDFQLTVVGTPCPGDSSGQDCFGIQQTARDVLVVDASKGNLRGRVEGAEVTLARANSQGSVTLTLTMDPDGRTCTGFAVEADSVRACTTNLEVVGTRRAGSCSGSLTDRTRGR